MPIPISKDAQTKLKGVDFGEEMWHKKNTRCQYQYLKMHKQNSRELTILVKKCKCGVVTNRTQDPNV
ncbi:unnamed protein product [Trifolium pratense]|uniref:Uncharacterized protein n=1 Tax=Trifolium pratense TaxID=57577 RepID=A0ACB0K0T3_TRIPR|nr:unnamed protein product [Trifolium pratense]